MKNKMDVYMEMFESEAREDIGLQNMHIKEKLSIKKSTWKPKKGELYYKPHIAGSRMGTFSFSYWNNTENEKKAYQLGLVCKTKREVNELVKRMLAAAKERRK